MRKLDVMSAHALSAMLTFNVAASIKMRKYSRSRAAHAGGRHLQCGRIYKDAEIWDVRDRRDDRHGAAFNVAASIKMRKFDEAEATKYLGAYPSMWPHL